MAQPTAGMVSGRADIGQHVVVAPAAGYRNGRAVGGRDLDLEDEAGIVFEAAPEHRREFEIIGSDSRLFQQALPALEALDRLNQRTADLAGECGQVAGRLFGAAANGEIGIDRPGFRLAQRRHAAVGGLFGQSAGDAGDSAPGDRLQPLRFQFAGNEAFRIIDPLLDQAVDEG